MKKLLLICILPLLIACAVTYTPVNIEPVKETFQAEGSKTELYVKAQLWMSEAFNNAYSVKQFEDKEEGIISGKYLLQPVYASSGTGAYQTDGIYAIIILQMKDNSSKITIKVDDFRVAEGSRSVKNATNLSYSKEDALNEISGLIASYKRYLNSENIEF